MEHVHVVHHHFAQPLWPHRDVLGFGMRVLLWSALRGVYRGTEGIASLRQPSRKQHAAAKSPCVLWCTILMGNAGATTDRLEDRKLPLEAVEEFTALSASARPLQIQAGTGGDKCHLEHGDLGSNCRQLVDVRPRPTFSAAKPFL